MDEQRDFSSSSSSDSTTCASDDVASSSNSWNNLAEAQDGGPLYHMDSLRTSLPLKRGLSSFYGGKSQSFSSLADVKSVEDLAKQEGSNYRRKKLKGCGLSSTSSMICKRPQKGSKNIRSKTALSFVMRSGSPVSLSKPLS